MLCFNFLDTVFKIETSTTKFICSLILAFLSSISIYGQEAQERQFLFKSKFDTTRYLLGSHIELKIVLPKSEGFIKMGDADLDKIFRSGYNRADHIQILQEYLTFEGDASKSNRHFQFKPAYYSTLPEDTVGYTIQVKAVYSFTSC
jgi:hypothetical protein